LRTLKGQFILHASLILLLAAILTLLSSTTLSRTSSDLATINSGSIPSVNDAQTITQDIETIDAQAADYLATAALTNAHACSIPQTTNPNGATISVTLTTHACDESDIDAETVLTDETLYQAAHNVTYTGEQTAVERITIGLESYLEDIHQMRVDYGLAANKTDPNDPYLKQAYQSYLSASGILHDQISLATIGADKIPLDKEANLPNCTLANGQTRTPDQWTQGGLTDALDCLSFINYSHLQGAYSDSGNFLGGSTAWIIVLSLLLGLLLLLGTGRMVLTSHRFLNLGLLAATLISLIFSGMAISLLGSLQGTNPVHSQDGAFVQLVQDDYVSVYDAAVLNRTATNANADESRWLIALEFHDQANVAHWQDDWNQSVQQVNTLIQKAQKNQTWQEEIQPLQDMSNNWNTYDTIDGQIRSAAQNQSDPKRLLTAESISTGTSNQAFGQFSGAVTALSNANQSHSNQTFRSINYTLMVYFILSLILFPLTGLLALWGIAIRLKDF
jgi:hypothetical protein